MNKLLIFLFLFIGFLQADNNRFLYDDWSTHQPVLYAVAMATKGPIIEFGCGKGSTDLLHEICEKEGRLLITIDDDAKKLNHLFTKYKASPWHLFFHVPGKDLKNIENYSHWIKFLNKFQLLNEVSFDVCFIDQSPWLARYETIKKMQFKARYLIIHDADYYPKKGIFGTVVKPIENRNPGEFDFKDVFSYFKVYFPNQPWPGDTGPPTLLGSNFDDDFPPVDFSSTIVIP